MGTVRKTITESTDAPSGLEIKRDGSTIKFTWKKGETYGAAQQLEYKIYEGTSASVAESGRNFLKQGFEITNVKWHTMTITKAATSATLNLPMTNYMPSTKKILYGIKFRVRGKAAEHSKTTTKGSGNKRVTTITTYVPQWSSWTERLYMIYEPPAPTISVSWSDSAVNSSTYTWKGASSDAHKPIYNIELQTVKKTNAPANVTGLADWKSASSTAKSLTGSQTYNETSHVGTSFARVVRVRTRGAGGYSAWKYAKHIFAEPYKPKITSSECEYKTGSPIRLTATWDAPADAQHPIDKNHLWYRIGKPTAGMGVTNDNSWTDAEPSNDVKKRYTTSVTIDEQIDKDECLWARVTSEHDADPAYSNAVRPYTGFLQTPGTPSITDIDNVNHVVEITCTNNSDVPDARLAIIIQAGPPFLYMSRCVAVSQPGNGTQVVSGIKCPDWSSLPSYGFRVYAFVGSYSYSTQDDGVRLYTVKSIMRSSETTTNGIPTTIPAPTLDRSENEEAGLSVTWEWSWSAATGAEISWSTKPNAWRSTDEPETFEVTKTHSSELDISDLELGETYYVRIRFYSVVDDEKIYTAYSDISRYYLSEAPAIPVLQLSDDFVDEGAQITASWVYISMDGTPQIYAEIAEATEVGGEYVYSTLAEATTEQSANITLPDTWTYGTQHAVAVRVVSASDQSSEWSDPVTITVATPLTAAITQSSLVLNGAEYELKAMPLTVTATGAGTAGMTELKIVRASDFTQDRPDETDYNGFTGEVITQRTYAGEDQQTIEIDDLYDGAHLDDTAQYSIIATVTDNYGRSDSASIDFTVAWTDQAVKPEGTVAIQDNVAFITIGTPAGAHEDDTVDIYRLSVDKPVLIYKGAEFGDVIVDPYPAMGAAGGYRLVLVTANGDYTTADAEFAWIDVMTDYNPGMQLIDFDGYQLPLLYNVDISSSWAKDYQETKYLGGTVRGDWLAGVSRTGSVASVKLLDGDVEDRIILRKLAEYSGVCHVRTKDGSSYAANIDVSVKSGYDNGGQPEDITLDITKTDTADLDGMTQEQWEEIEESE